MMNYLIGIMAMIGGFISYVIDNPVGVYGCFGYAFILWCVMAVFEYKESRKTKEFLDEYEKIRAKYLDRKD